MSRTLNGAHHVVVASAPPVADPPVREKRRVESPRREEPARKKQVKADRFRTVSQIKGGARLCKPWNDGRGCSNGKCDAIHACDVKLESGQACMSKKHTRLQHE